MLEQLEARVLMAAHPAVRVPPTPFPSLVGDYWGDARMSDGEGVISFGVSKQVGPVLQGKYADGLYPETPQGAYQNSTLATMTGTVTRKGVIHVHFAGWGAFDFVKGSGFARFSGVAVGNVNEATGVVSLQVTTHAAGHTFHGTGTLTLL